MKRYAHKYDPHRAVYHIIDQQRGEKQPMAKTESAYDAERIVDALNAAEVQG